MKRIQKLLVCLFMILLFLFTAPISIIGSSLSNEVEFSDYYRSKIDNKIINALERGEEDISVILWLKDIDNDARNQALVKGYKMNGLAGFVNEELPNIANIRMGDKEYETVNENIDNYLEITRQIGKQLITEHNGKIMDELKSALENDVTELYRCRYAPMIFCKVKKEDIINISKSENVVRMFRAEELEYSYEESFEEEPQLQNNRDYNPPDDYGVWQNNTNISTLHSAYGASGQGVKIGLVELREPNFSSDILSDETKARLNAQFSYSISNNLLELQGNPGVGNANNIEHANYMLSIIAGKVNGVYTGIAPNAKVYCAGFESDQNYSYYKPIEDLIDKNVNVICTSFTMGPEEATYDYHAMFVDYIVSNYHVTFCKSSGNNNYTQTNIRNGVLAYNALVAGNIEDYNTLTLNDDVINYSSVYSGSTNSAYKPDLCAPGSRAGTYSYPGYTIGGNGGTSAANAIMTGICALLMGGYPVLKTNPVLIKSVLMSSAKVLPNMTDVYSTSSSTEPALLRNYGAGLVDVAEANQTLYNNRYMNIVPSNSIITDTIQIKKKDINREKDIFISLNWMQPVSKIQGYSYQNNNYYTIGLNVHHTLELYDPNNVKVATSDYLYDRKQFIRFKPLSEGYYTVKVIRDSSASYPYPISGIAYTVR